MPRNDWRHDDELMSRERSDRGYEDRERGAMFDRDRGDRGDRDEREPRRRPIGGWGGLMEDERSGGLSIRDRSGERERSFGPDDDRSGIPRDETQRLIASNKVEGTPVFDRHGDRLGSIHNFMVDKIRGHVVYAVLRHSSGFLGLDERFYPLDWDQLTYDTRLGGYHIDMTEDELKNLGSWDKNQRWQGRCGGTGGSTGPERGRFERGPERGSDRDRDFERGRFEREREFGRGRDRSMM